MTISVVSSEAEFEALKGEWCELHAANPNHTPFQTWEWNYHWWLRCGTPGTLRLLVVRRESQLVGIAPLFLRRRYRGLPLRHLAFLTNRRGDYLDFLVRAGDEPQFFAELFAYLREHAREWRFLQLRDMRESSSNLPHLLSAALAQFPGAGIETSDLCATVPLAGSWNAFLDTLGKNMRRNAVRYRKQLEEQCAVRFAIPETPDEMRRGLADFATVYQRRWRPEIGATLFDDADSLAFERDVCEAGTAAGWYRLYLLYVNDEPAAGYLGYVCHGKYYAGLLAHDPRFHKLSVGTVLIARTVEDCIAHGWSELDMTRGVEAYKFQWNARQKRGYLIKICRNRGTAIWVDLIDWLYRSLTEMPLLRAAQKAYRLRKAPRATATLEPLRPGSPPAIVPAPPERPAAPRRAEPSTAD